MSPLLLFFFAALINWISTTILVESSLFAPLRDRVFRWAVVVRLPDGRILPPTGAIPPDLSRQDIEAGTIVRRWYSEKASQLVSCIMCIGVWVGFIEAITFGGPLHVWGVLGVIANGLLYKAGGHFIYELRSRVAK